MLTRHARPGRAVLAGVLTAALVVALNAAYASAAPRVMVRLTATGPGTIDGETLNGTTGTSGATTSCNGLNGTFTYGVSGTATGPYAGTFTDSGSITLAGGVPTALTATFDITSSGNTVTGTEALETGTTGTGTCVTGYGQATLNGSYNATINGTTHDSGTTTLSVTGGSTAMSALLESFTAPAGTHPTVTAVSPNGGSTTGGGSVTITGTAFTNTTGVAFGKTAAATWLVNNDGNITATTPAHAAGTVDVTVTTTTATSTTSTADDFTYGTPPGAPTNVTATRGTGSATIKWTAPTSTGGLPLVAYVITPYLNNVAETPKLYGLATNETVTGLQHGQSYTFTVTAVNAAGTGTPSAKSNAVSPK
jgi:hypothetical protein